MSIEIDAYRSIKRRRRNIKIFAFLFFILLLIVAFYFISPDKFKDVKNWDFFNREDIIVQNQTVINETTVVNETWFNHWFFLGIAALLIFTYFLVKLILGSNYLSGDITREEAEEYLLEYLNSKGRIWRGYQGEEVTWNSLTIHKNFPEYWAGKLEHKFYLIWFSVGVKFPRNASIDTYPYNMCWSVGIRASKKLYKDDVVGPVNASWKDFLKFKNDIYYGRVGTPPTSHKSEGINIEEQIQVKEAIDKIKQKQLEQQIEQGL